MSEGKTTDKKLPNGLAQLKELSMIIDDECEKAGIKSINDESRKTVRDMPKERNKTKDVVKQLERSNTEIKKEIDRIKLGIDKLRDLSEKSKE